jgi:hypothetical protein
VGLDSSSRYWSGFPSFLHLPDTHSYSGVYNHYFSATDAMETLWGYPSGRTSVLGVHALGVGGGTGTGGAVPPLLLTRNTVDGEVGTVEIRDSNMSMYREPSHSGVRIADDRRLAVRGSSSLHPFTSRPSTSAGHRLTKVESSCLDPVCVCVPCCRWCVQAISQLGVLVEALAPDFSRTRMLPALGRPREHPRYVGDGDIIWFVAAVRSRFDCVWHLSFVATVWIDDPCG